MFHLSEKSLVRFLGKFKNNEENLYQVEDEILHFIHQSPQLNLANTHLTSLNMNDQNFIMVEVLGPPVDRLPTDFHFVSLLKHTRWESLWEIPSTKSEMTSNHKNYPKELDTNEYISGWELKRTLDEEDKFRLEYRNVLYQRQLLNPIMEVVYQRKEPGT